MSADCSQSKTPLRNQRMNTVTSEHTRVIETSMADRKINRFDPNKSWGCGGSNGGVFAAEQSPALRNMLF